MGEKWPKESGSNDGLTANAEYVGAVLTVGVCAIRYSLCGQGLPSSYNPDTDMLLCFVPTRAWKTT